MRKRDNVRGERVSARKETKEEAECNDEYPDRVNTSKVSDTKIKIMFSHLLEFLVSARREAEEKKKSKEGNKNVCR